MARSPKRVVFLVLLAMAAIELGVLITVYLARSSDDTAASTVASDLPAPPKPVDVEQPPDPALNTNRVDPAERSPAASDRQAIDLAATSSATLRAGDGTVLHVRVVAKDGSPLTSGRIDCDWKGRRKADTPRGLVSANISGIITDVLLPPIAETCAVTASLPARLPARVELAGFRRKALELAPMIGRVDCDVRVTLVDTIAGPTLSGVIIVNGEKRVPDGIDIIVDSVSGNALVNRADATYVVPRLPHGAPKSVRVESDENMPHSFGDPEADADGNWKLDLALKSRRSLHVRAVDTSTSGPAQFVELVLDVGTSRIVHKSTDAGGECVFRGLPERGTVRLYDARQRRGLEAPLFSMSLSPDTPDENLARVSMNAPRARVWGSVPTQLLAGRGGSRTSAVRRARSREPGGPTLGDAIVDVDAEGRWSFDCEVPSQWIVWVGERDSTSSQVQRIVVDRAGDGHQRARDREEHAGARFPPSRRSGRVRPRPHEVRRSRARRACDTATRDRGDVSRRERDAHHAVAHARSHELQQELASRDHRSTIRVRGRDRPAGPA
jgi:hypothetical protein